MDEFLDRYPWLVTIAGPLTGALLQRLQAAGKLRGFALLGVSAAVATGIVGAWGLASGWSVAQWRDAPLLVLVILGWSNLTGSTLAELRERRGKG